MMKNVIGKVVQGESLNYEEAQAAMLYIMEGKASDAQIGSFLTALRIKGETAEEIAGCAAAMRRKALQINSDCADLVDTCGTGGDGSGTFNISTTAAFVVAGAGVPVAKHGNRAVSGKSGSADLLEALGAKLDLPSQEVERIMNTVGIGFLYAPAFHQAMKYAAGPRREIGIRSIFNVLGPLANPARASAHLLGVYEPELTETIAGVLNRLGVKRAFVVHGLGGLDELSTIGPTKISRLEGGSIKTYLIRPQDFGLPQVKLEELQGGDARQNAVITREILEGKKGPQRDIVLLNAAAAFVVCGRARDLTEGIRVAAESIETGMAAEKLKEFIKATNNVVLNNAVGLQYRVVEN